MVRLGQASVSLNALYEEPAEMRCPKSATDGGTASDCWCFRCLSRFVRPSRTNGIVSCKQALLRHVDEHAPAK